jgi:amidohydrolase
VTAAKSAGTRTEWLDRHRDDVIAWRHHIHRHPELGHQEFLTTAFIVDKLRSAGLEPVVLPGGSGLTVDLGDSGPFVALRADLDALPITEAANVSFASEVDGAMHACGHDVHTAALLGAVLALSQEPIPGRVRAIFQPAEEVMTGALLAVEAGVMRDVERIYMLHVSPQMETGKIGAATGAATSSSDAITVQLSGPGGHSSRPNDTADLVYALGLLATNLPGLLTRRLDPLHAGVLVWGQATAGSAANVIPTSGTLRGTLRLGNRAAWDEAPDLVAELISQILAPTRIRHTLDYARGVPPVVNDAHSVATVVRVAETILAPNSFIALPQGGAGEDFAYYLDSAPGALVALGVWDGQGQPTSVHRETFRADDAAVPLGARMYAELALAALHELS